MLVTSASKEHQNQHHKMTVAILLGLVNVRKVVITVSKVFQIKKLVHKDHLHLVLLAS